MAIALHYAARSDVGLVRSNNQDSGYAGPSLLVIADGMGGHAGGDVASSLAIGEMAPLDGESHRADAVLGHLSDAVHAAHRELLDRVAEEPALSGMGTTVTALLRTGGRLALAHIGDSRAYLLRDGQLVQLTRDHTFVQRLVDDGRITAEEAEQHPQRSVLMRVLSDVVDDVEPDLSMREARLGDRYLLCSDGLSSVVSFETLQDTMAAGKSPAETCEQLVQLALRSGAPDNVTCIVADIVDAVGTPTDTVPIVVGAASNREQPRPPRPGGGGGSAAERAAELTAIPAPEAARDDGPAPHRRSGRILRIGLASLVVAAVLGVGGWGAYRWSQGQFFVGASQGSVAIFRGLPQDVGPLKLSSVASLAPDVAITDLPQYTRNQVEQGIVTNDEPSAQSVVQQLRITAAQCRAAANPTPSVTPTTKPATAPTTKPTAPTTKSTAPAAAPKAGTQAAAGATSSTAPAPTATGSATEGSGGGGTADDCRGLG
jgi:serine/threonine protein phosphatase PrpC